MSDQTVRGFYKLGQKANKRLELAEGTYGSKVIPEFAKENGISVSQIYKAQRFAKLYSKEEFEQFCGRLSPGGKSLGIGHACELIEVGDPKARSRLESDAAQHGWSVRNLNRERKKLNLDDSQAKRGGRPQRVPVSREDLLLQLEEHVTRVRRWIEGLSTTNDKGRRLMRKELAQLTPKVRKAIDKLSVELDATLLAVQKFKRTRRILAKKAAIKKKQK